MIHIQIARDITTVGVAGVRWVLVEASEDDPPAAPAPSAVRPTASPAAPPTAPPAAPPAAPPTAPQALAAARPARSGQRRIGLWQLAITGLGLLAALGLAQRQWGLPRLPWLGAPAVSLPTVPPPVPVAPAAAPPTDAARASPAPAAPEAWPPADPPVSDGTGPALPMPAASAAQAERLIIAGLR